MNRKDTILVAVLINAGLLIVLFACALKSNAPSTELSQNALDSSQTFDLSSRKETLPVIGDEVDQVLSQYANPSPVIATTVTPTPVENLSKEVVSTPVTPNAFAEDLKPFSKPETSFIAPTAQSVATESTTEKSSYSEHKVKKGDVLDKIARHHNCSVNELMKLNKLNSTNLRIGQVLKIPAKLVASNNKKAPSSESVAASKENQDSSPKYYVVKNGDNPWTIAVKNHIKVEELLKLNDLNEEKARRLKPGDQIRIR